jgi:hypothetical protein
MRTPNENGVYPAELTEEVARTGHAHATLSFCHCDDGQHRFAVSMEWSTGGRGEPISAEDEGFATLAEARDAGLQRLLARWPAVWPSEPQSVRDELQAMKAQIQARFSQPSLF